MSPLRGSTCSPGCLGCRLSKYRRLSAPTSPSPPFQGRTKPPPWPPIPLALSPVEPQVFPARTIVDAVDHDSQPLHPGIPAACRAVVVDHRPGAVLLQFAVDLPDQTLAFVRVGFHRLPVELLFELAVAIARVIALRPTRKVLVERLVGIVEAVLAEIEADGEVLAHDLGIPVHRIDLLEFAVDIDLFQLVEQNNC